MTFKCSSHKLRSPIVWGVVLSSSNIKASKKYEISGMSHWMIQHLIPEEKRLQPHWCRRPKTCTVINCFKALSWHSLRDYQMHAHKHFGSYKILKYGQFLICLMMITTYNDIYSMIQIICNVMEFYMFRLCLYITNCRIWVWVTLALSKKSIYLFGICCNRIRKQCLEIILHVTIQDTRMYL